MVMAVNSLELPMLSYFFFLYFIQNFKRCRAPAPTSYNYNFGHAYGSYIPSLDTAELPFFSLDQSLYYRT